MKYLKSILLSLMLCLVASPGYAQTTDEVTLTVSSDGPTKEEATKNALRNAIEQAYGTFVSANTTILNDELVKDEIVTIANGNIKSYEEISSTAMPDGSQFVTLKATVSVSKLISYAQSKGAETEFAGATFGMNMKLKELNKQNEKKVLENLIVQVKEMMPYVFDRTLNIKDPVVVNDSLYAVEFMIKTIPNDNMNTLHNVIYNTIKSISLTVAERSEYKDLGLETYEYGKLYDKWETKQYGPIAILRDNEDLFFRDLMRLFEMEILNYAIVDNLQTESYSVYSVSDKYPTSPNPNFCGYIQDRAGKEIVSTGVSVIKDSGLFQQKIDRYSDGFIAAYGSDTRYVDPNERSGMARWSSLDLYYVLNYGYPEINMMKRVAILKSDISKYNNFKVIRRDNHE